MKEGFKPKLGTCLGKDGKVIIDEKKIINR